MNTFGAFSKTFLALIDNLALLHSPVGFLAQARTKEELLAMFSVELVKHQSPTSSRPIWTSVTCEQETPPWQPISLGNMQGSGVSSFSNGNIHLSQRTFVG